MKTLIQRFARDESGATAIEYGLIAAGIAVAIIAIINTIGGQLLTEFTSLSGQLGGGSGGGGSTTGTGG